jgi:hypothetical protein
MLPDQTLQRSIHSKPVDLALRTAILFFGPILCCSSILANCPSGQGRHRFAWAETSTPWCRHVRAIMRPFEGMTPRSFRGAQ